MLVALAKSFEVVVSIVLVLVMLAVLRQPPE